MPFVRQQSESRSTIVARIARLSRSSETWPASRSTDRGKSGEQSSAMCHNLMPVFVCRLILFPLNSKKPRKGESSEEEIKMAQQLTGTIFPIVKNNKSLKSEKSRVPSEQEKKFQAFHSLRRARANKRLVGIREKKAKEAAEALDAPKK